MAILKDPEMAAFDISEGVMNITPNGIWGNSAYNLKLLLKGLVDIQNELLRNSVDNQFKIQPEDLDYDEIDGTDMTDIKLHRIDHALSILHDYFKKHRIS